MKLQKKIHERKIKKSYKEKFMKKNNPPGGGLFLSHALRVL
jgi:hypothetical protein